MSIYDIGILIVVWLLCMVVSGWIMSAIAYIAHVLSGVIAKWKFKRYTSKLATKIGMEVVESLRSIWDEMGNIKLGEDEDDGEA